MNNSSLLLCAAVGATYGCADLATMQENVCGNGVVEPAAGEECDLFPQSACRPRGEKDQCRFDCSKNPCPAGFNCGRDQICRRASGHYLVSDEVSSDGWSKLFAGDFDDDGFGDILASTATRIKVLYANASAGIEAAVELDFFIWLPTVAVGDLSADGISDVALLSDDGIVIGRGRANRKLQPTIASSFVLGSSDARPLLLDALSEYREDTRSPTGKSSPGIGDELLVFTGKEVLLRDETMESDGPVAFLPEDTSRIVGEIQIGQLYEDPAFSPCQEFGIAFRGKPWLWFYTPCAFRDGELVLNLGKDDKPLVSLPLLRLPEGWTAGPFVLGDFNGDTHLDVLAFQEETFPDEQWVELQSAWAYGNGSGSFHSDPYDIPVAPAFGDSAMSSFDLFGLWAEPLAAGYLDQDACFDIVTTEGILLSGGRCDPQKLEELETRWFELSDRGVLKYARIADFNGNGITDVAAFLEDSSKLLFLNGLGNGSFAEFEVPLNAKPGPPTVGDFDGDSIEDLAFREAGTLGKVNSGALTGDSLSVCFGNPFGAPSPPQSMGRLGRIQHVVGGNLWEMEETDIRDIVVFSKSEDENATSAAILHGSSDRQLVSPLQLAALGNDEQFPCELMIGNFYPDSARHLDLGFLMLAITEDENSAVLSQYLSMVPTSEDAFMDATLVTSSASASDIYFGDEDDLEGIFGWFLPAVVDLDAPGSREGLDEVVLLGWSVDKSSSKRHGFIGVARSVAQNGKRVFQLEKPVEVPEVFGRREEYASSGQGDEEDSWRGLRGKAEVADVDMDGARDILALAELWNEDGTLVTKTMLVLFVNTKNGKLDPEHRVVFENPDERLPTSFALIQADGDPEPEVLVLTAASAYIADMDIAGARLKVARPLPDVADGSDAVAADFDGDGVQDLAVSSLDKVTLFKGAAVIP